MNPKKTVISTLVIMAILLSALALPVAAFADSGCGSAGTSGDDTIVCDTDTTGNVNAEEGDDSITVETGVTVTGNVRGDLGDDTITNNGVVEGNLSGRDDDDTITNAGTANSIFGGGGDDAITNSSIVVGRISGGSGNDEITNSGTTESITGNGGNDTITNSGTVTGGIAGGLDNDEITNSGTADSISGRGGDDTITNSGTVTNNIEANIGNDTVILETGVQVGGMISGANTERAAAKETDTLVFNMSTYNRSEYYAAQTVIAGATDELETYKFGWDGGVISWQYFDNLIDNLALMFKSKPESAPGPAATATVIFVGEGFLIGYQNDVSGTLRFYGLGENSQTFIAELAAQSWENAEPGKVLLDVESHEIGTRLVVTMFENGHLQVEYFSLADGTSLYSKTIVP